MSGRLYGKTALITGSSTGIGKACALLFSEEGAKVVINGSGRNPKDGPAVVEEIRAAGREACYFAADVCKGADVEAMVEFAISRYGQLDILMNNAVTGVSAALTEQDEAEWDSVYLSSIKAIFTACKTAIPAMIKAGRGSIINVSSIHGLFGARSLLAYATFKGGIQNMTRQMAVDYGRYGIRVNALSPGRIVTERKVEFLDANPEEYRRQKAVYPLGRPGTVREAAYAALFLASDESSFITGHNLVVDGGLTIQLQDSIVGPLEKGISEELLERGVNWP
ncbi:MAG: SDR family oxidoreductase [Oscillospiraceae bacterium]|nr:SDR family oxidoreductase [Oscillospiraceae bacterium]